MSDFFDKLSDRDFRTIIAYFIVMLCLGSISFSFLFELDGYYKVKEFDGMYFGKWWKIGSFYVGISALFGMFLSTFFFFQKIFVGVSPRDIDLLERALRKIELPTIISKMDLTIILSSEAADRFYGTKLVDKNYTKLDSYIESYLENKEEWITNHNKRIKVALDGGLDSTSKKTMKFKHIIEGHKEWRLTSCSIMMDGGKFYFTIISPATEDNLIDDV